MNAIPSNDQISVTTAGGIEVLQTIAGVGGRSYAFIIDWHIRLLIVLVWFLIAIVMFDMGFTGDFFERLLGDNNKPNFIFYIAILPPLLIYFFYHPVLEILMEGRTPGKRIAGNRMVKPYCRGDISGVNSRAALPLIGVHLKDPADPLLAVLSAV